MNEFFSDKDFLNRLEHLVFLSKRVLSGKKGGIRRGGSYGVGLEYADHRDYATGDDIRYVDWDLYGRSGKFYTKLFLEDEDINIFILIDRSRSMDFGNPQKFQYALKLAASLGYIGFSHLDHVGVGYFSDDIEQSIPPQRGKNHLYPFLEFLRSFSTDRSTDLNRSMENFAAQVKNPGLVIILSDFFDEKGYERGLKYLLYRRLEVHAIQILSKNEIDPDFKGMVRLGDVEGNHYSEIDVDEDVLGSYKKELDSYNSRFKAFCQSNGIPYIQAVTDIPFDQFLTKYFKLQL